MTCDCGRPACTREAELKRRVAEQDRELAELRAQLDALEVTCEDCGLAGPASDRWVCGMCADMREDSNDV